MLILPNDTLSYDDVLLLPKKGVLAKREDADISTNIGLDFDLNIPILSAPMTSVTGTEMALQMNFAGGRGVFPRFGYSEKEVISAYYEIPGKNAIWAIGLDLNYYKLLYDLGARYFCFDVAHAHHDSVGAFLANLPHRDEIYLMAGNVATREGAHYLAHCGADAIKVGIGPGAACTTREVTGFGVGQLSAVDEVASLLQNHERYLSRKGLPIRVIADGGIKNSGDIVKALAAGADAVMLGKLLAAADEAPGKGDYYGMASKRINGHHAPEGAEGKVELVGPLRNVLKQLTWGLRSGLSYAGARNLQELRDNAVFQRVAPGVHLESSVRL